ncbi:MAG: FAD:protein FMN transferase [Rubrivivax sp.]|nr:FAD:protein FMN transferase [Rubrivivax sp.]
MPDVVLSRTSTGWRGAFGAMASPCEVLLENDAAQAAAAPSAGIARDEALRLTRLAQAEALRIECKFSRYRDDSVVARLHASGGTAVTVDDETAGLIDFAAHCHAASGGLFDITSGVLRHAWRFDGGSMLPDAALVERLRQRVGWERVHWQRPRLTLPEGMEIDLGGIGKEYAVDRALALLRAETAAPLLVNFGGDLAVSGPRPDGSAWAVGIDSPGPTSAGSDAAAAARTAAGVLALSAGALATSGDARRFVLADGVRYGHILDPRTGWPVRGAPRSVTVAAPTCTEAGVLATLAMLRGGGARAWLAEQGAPHWIVDD